MPRLDLDPGGAAPAGVVGRRRRLDHHALVAGVERRRVERRRPAPGRRPSCAAPAAPRAARRPAPPSARCPGASSRSAPSRCSRSKKYGVSVDPVDPPAPRSAARRGRPGWPPGSTSPGTAAAAPRRRAAIASPSSTMSRAGSARTAATTSGRRGGDLVEAAGEHRDVVAAAVHLDADAVELHVDRRRHAGGAERVVDARRAGASIGASGRPTWSANSASAPTPPSSAATATVLRSPTSSSARRTAGAGTSAARAIASASSPAWAPCRSSPLNSPTQHPLLVGRGGGEQRAEQTSAPAPATRCR